MILARQTIPASPIRLPEVHECRVGLGEETDLQETEIAEEGSKDISWIEEIRE
jgi:hypothetical protein